MLDGGRGGGAALKLMIKMDAGALPLPPAHLPGRIQAHQVHQVLQRGGGPGCAAAGAQRHPPGEEALGGRCPGCWGGWVGWGDPPAPGGGVASRWVRQDLVDGSLSTKRAPAFRRGGLVPQNRAGPRCPCPKGGLVPGVLAGVSWGAGEGRCWRNWDALQSREVGTEVERRRGGDGTPPSQHPPAGGSPVPLSPPVPGYQDSVSGRGGEHGRPHRRLLPAARGPGNLPHRLPRER